MATIPFDSSSQAELLSEVEVAHYELGKIYHFQLSEDLNAIHTFDTMLVRFPSSEYKPEVLYLLYLMSKGMDSLRTEHYSSSLISEFPSSIYAKLINNPNYREESQAIKNKLERIYKDAYSKYQNEDFEKSLRLINSALLEHPNNDFSDNMALLKVLVIGKMETIYQYQFELGSFIKKYPESELLPYAQKLLKTSEEHQINLINSSKAKFFANLDKPHIMVIAYENKEDAATNIPNAVESIIKEINPDHELRLGNLILSSSRAMVIINEFASKEEALAFFTKFQTSSNLSDQYKSQKFVNFVITNDNFNVLYQTKELDSYKKFFDRNYKLSQ